MNSRQTIVGDSSPLIALAIIGQLEVLPRLFQRVIVPQAEWEEVTEKGAGLPGAVEVSRLSWLDIQTPEPALLQPQTILVDRSEAQAIALALTHPGSTVLLDDGQARRVAERFGVERIGKLGILRRAKKAGYIAAVKPLVVKLQSGGIYRRQSLVDVILRDVDELNGASVCMWLYCLRPFRLCTYFPFISAGQVSRGSRIGIYGANSVPAAGWASAVVPSALGAELIKCITNATRRFLTRPSSVSLLATGWVSPYPTARTRCVGIPPAIKARVTSVARCTDSSQFDANMGVEMGILSVWPSMENETPASCRRVAIACNNW